MLNIMIDVCIHIEETLRYEKWSSCPRVLPYTIVRGEIGLSGQVDSLADVEWKAHSLNYA